MKLPVSSLVFITKISIIFENAIRLELLNTVSNKVSFLEQSFDLCSCEMLLSLGKMSALLLCVAGDGNPQRYTLALREEYWTGVLASCTCPAGVEPPPNI